MKSVSTKRIISLLFVFAAATVLVLSQTETSYSWSGGGSGWSSGSSGSGSTATCVASNLSLSLATADCHKCHTGSDTVLANMHHNLINTQGKKCLDCHVMAENPPGTFTPIIVRDCIACHGPSVHDTVTHCVQNTCGRCHTGSISDIHAGTGRSRYHGGTYGGSSSTSGISVCYLCHLSTNSTVQQTIAKGLSGQVISCRNCHG